jgi:hypothetical protein
MRPSRAVRKSARTVVQEAHTMSGLAAIVAQFIPMEMLEVFKPGTRRRIFTPMITFMAFLAQVMNNGCSCRESVRRLQAWFLDAKLQSPDDSTSAYCQARKRLDIGLIYAAFDKLNAWFLDHVSADDLWMGREVKVIDGTRLSMPDTDANGEEFTYASLQKAGCGFPGAKLVAVFSLIMGNLESYSLSDWRDADAYVCRSLVPSVAKKSVVVIDAGFCGWGLMATFLKQEVDVVVRLNKTRKVSAQHESWAKPKDHKGWDETEWNSLPASIAVRIVSFKIEEPGYRTETIVLVTTLLDTQKYSDQAIIDLFAKRWDVELNFRDIKVTLGMDIVRTRSPDMIEKEVAMQAIAFNIVRGVMLMSARQHGQQLRSISFKGTVDTMRQWVTFMRPASPLVLQSRWTDMLSALAADKVPDRPGRSEPRAVKRRPQAHVFLRQPRASHQKCKSLSNASKRALS